ncbi:hypothetical protein [Streptomyces sp. NPDC058572]|uniref:hypothetical protein n=1 Tax=Streptomyces sp. NPDC058572 TaxID=3346546 RepID=UPI00365A8F92
MTADALRSDHAAEELREERYGQAHEAWTEFTAAMGAVSVAGPTVVAEEANALSEAVWELDAAGTDWRDALRAGRQRGLKKIEERFDTAMDGIQPPRAAFRHAARQALGTD